MRVYIYNLWLRCRQSFFFIPTIMTVTAAALAIAMLYVDERIGTDWVQDFRWIYLTDPSGARVLLSTVAGSMITVAGVVFSITIVVLTLASNQYGPRLLRNFIQDRGNQVVLGTFVATYIYCLLVLRRILGSEDNAFVPHLAIAVGMILAILGIMVLIYYIHHVAVAMQADSVVAAVSRELRRSIERQFPKPVGQQVGGESPLFQDSTMPPAHFLSDSAPVPGRSSGYIQAVDHEYLVTAARDYDGVIYLNYRPGQYVISQTPLAQVWPGDQFDEKWVEQINSAFIIGPDPSPDQDVEFAIRQLVEVAVRSLSPGINDPFTAIRCIDSLADALGSLATRELPKGFLHDSDGMLRLIAQPVDFSAILDAAFNQIRQYGADSVAVTIRLLEAATLVARLTQRDDDRVALIRHVRMIADGAIRCVPQPGDRKDVLVRYRAAAKVLGFHPEDFSDKVAGGANGSWDPPDH